MKFPKLTILEKEMTRAEFLKNLGLGALLVAGGSTLAKFAVGAGSDQQTTMSRAGATNTYGVNSYGGR